MLEFDQTTLSTCAYCPRLCRDVCPVAIGENRETLIVTHKMAIADLIQRNLLPFDKETTEIFFACTDCGACTASCKHRMEPSSILYQGRQDAFANALVPQSVHELLAKIEEHGNPYGRIDQIFTTPKEPTVDSQLILDCATSANRPEQGNLLLDALRKSKHSSSSLFPPALSSGPIIYASGAKKQHEDHLTKLQQAGDGLSEIFVSDPHDLKYFQKHFSPTSQEAKVITDRMTLLLEVFERTLPILSAPNHTKLVMYHDSSALGRFAGCYELPRRLLGRLGYQLKEFTRNQYHASGSAAGGIYRWTSPDGAKQAAQWLLKEVHEVTEAMNLDAPPPVITVGETERSHLADAAPDLEILDLNVLIAKVLV